MRELALARLKQMKMSDARIKAMKDPEYKEIKKQVEELISKKHEVLDKLTKKYYNELEES